MMATEVKGFVIEAIRKIVSGQHSFAGLPIAIAERFQAGDLSAPSDEHDRAGHQAFADIGLQGVGQPLQALGRKANLLGPRCARYFQKPSGIPISRIAARPVRRLLPWP